MNLVSDYTKGTIDLEADGSQVWVRLIRLNSSTMRIKISARKYHFPNVSLAQEVFTKIMDEAK